MCHCIRSWPAYSNEYQKVKMVSQRQFFFTKICPMNVWIKNNSYYTTILLITCAGLTSCPSKFNKWEQNPHFLSVIIILPCVLHLFSLSVTSAINAYSWQDIRISITMNTSSTYKCSIMFITSTQHFPLLFHFSCPKFFVNLNQEWTRRFRIQSIRLGFGSEWHSSVFFHLI